MATYKKNSKEKWGKPGELETDGNPTTNIATTYDSIPPSETKNHDSIVDKMLTVFFSLVLHHHTEKDDQVR